MEEFQSSTTFPFSLLSPCASSHPSYCCCSDLLCGSLVRMSTIVGLCASKNISLCLAFNIWQLYVRINTFHFYVWNFVVVFDHVDEDYSLNGKMLSTAVIGSLHNSFVLVCIVISSLIPLYIYIYKQISKMLFTFCFALLAVDLLLICLHIHFFFCLLESNVRTGEWIILFNYRSHEYSMFDKYCLMCSFEF